jgi:broad-specificity NMP kinase
MKQLYIIGGTMGVGKSAVCKELKTRLNNSVFLDGDWCWDANPFQVTDETKSMVMDNISYILNNFIICSAYQNVIFCWVIHEQSIIDELMGRLNVAGCDVKIISLVATELTLREHIEKDIATGIRSDGDVERSINRIKLYDTLNTKKISVDRKSTGEIADEIITP